MKYIFLFIGFLSLALGVLGIFLPVLPTTPFLLLAATLFFRSSPRAYAWLLNHKYLGAYIRNFREDKSIPLHAKIVTLLLLWLTAVNCSVFVFTHWALRGMMVVIAVGVTYYILSLKTKRTHEKVDIL